MVAVVITMNTIEIMVVEKQEFGAFRYSSSGTHPFSFHPTSPGLSC